MTEAWIRVYLRILSDTCVLMVVWEHLRHLFYSNFFTEFHEFTKLFGEISNFSAQEISCDIKPGHKLQCISWIGLGLCCYQLCKNTWRQEDQVRERSSEVVITDNNLCTGVCMRQIERWTRDLCMLYTSKHRVIARRSFNEAPASFTTSFTIHFPSFHPLLSLINTSWIMKN